MSNRGTLLWRGYIVEWRHSAFVSDKDFTPRPHFIISATDERKDEKVTYDNVVIKDAKLKAINDFGKLPEKVRIICLDQLIDTLERKPPYDKR